MTLPVSTRANPTADKERIFYYLKPPRAQSLPLDKPPPSNFQTQKLAAEREADPERFRDSFSLQDQ